MPDARDSAGTALDVHGLEGERTTRQEGRESDHVVQADHGNPIPEKSAQRVLKVADQILKAGKTEDDEAES